MWKSQNRKRFNESSKSSKRFNFSWKQKGYKGNYVISVNYRKKQKKQHKDILKKTNEEGFKTL